MTAYDRMLQRESQEWNEAYDEECTSGEILDEMNLSDEVHKLIDDLDLELISVNGIGKFTKEDFEIYTATGIF